MENQTTYQTNTFYYHANEYVKHATEEDKIEQTNMTQTFYKEIEEMIKNNEIVIININGKMRLGKSTQAIALGEHIWTLLQKYGHRKKNEKFGLKNIARDQREHSKLMRQPDTQYTVLVIDESNELENTGENITIEKALSADFSNIQAARYNHAIYCSPKSIIDTNADIILTLISIDKKTQTSHNKLYYRFHTGGNEYIQLLGYVNINVSKIIKNWETHAKKHYQKPDQQKTPEDHKKIQQWRKKDYYIEYIIKKYQKMELITKHGIFRPRLLDYADMILTTTEKTKKIAMNTNIPLKDTIKNFIKIEARKQKIPLSIIGLTLATEEAMGITTLYKSLSAIQKEKTHTINQELKGKTNTTQTNAKLQPLNQAERDIAEAISKQLDELRLYQKINKQYHETQTNEKEETN